MRDSRSITGGILLVPMVAAALVSPASNAATPPSLVNYQGVLRDPNDKPLSGTYDMTFRFLDASTGGNEILIDQHAASSANAVTVSGGLFDVALGSGTVLDGSGPGTYTSLDAVFRDYGSVWLEVKVGAETLSPRTPIRSAAYALNATSAVSAASAANASQLNGYPSTSFLDVASDYQTKTGPLQVTSADPSVAVLGVVCNGTSMGYRSDSCGDYGAYLSSPGTGVLGAGGYYGVRGYGTVGGYFDNNGQNVFLAGDGPDGAGGAAYGTSRGVFFSSSGENYGDIGFFDGFKYYGIWAHGYHEGGYFENAYSGTYAFVGDYQGSSIVGNGAKNFVQNHPLRADRAIVYAALEGDEVGTYTRGSGHLLQGEARIRLGETFPWVTAPEIGLTVYVTPVGRPARLYVAEKSTTEIVVRAAPGDPDVDFDYIVTGLRVGFEDANVVREKTAPAPVPTMIGLVEQQQRHPELSASTPRARFETMARQTGRPISASYPRSAALLAQINAADHGSIESAASAAARRPALDRRIVAPSAPGGAARLAPPAAEAPVAARYAGTAAPGSAAGPETGSPGAAGAPGTTFEVSEAVEAGDVLALDPAEPGKLRRAASVMDPDVVGVAADVSRSVDGVSWVAVAATRYASVRVDAGFGAIHPGDLLVSSPAPGRAMTSENPLPGTVIGKAIDGLGSGTGSIRVLLGAR